MFRVIIDQQCCKACGLCVEFCPKHIIELSPELNEAGHHPAYVASPEDCTGCGNCAVMCPDVCIEIYRVKAEAKIDG